MKKKSTSLMAMVIVGIVFLVSTCKKKEVIAIVNGEPISKVEFERLYANVENYYARMVGVPTDDPKFQEMMAKVRGQLLESMINEKLLLQEARKRNITVSREDVDAHINMVKQKYGEDAFINALTQQGITEEEYRKELTKQMLVNKLREEVTKDINVTEEEAKEYYEKHKDKFTQPEMVHVRHILLPTEEEAKKVMERIRKGEDFGKIAKEVSTDTGSKDKGGDLGYFSRGKMVKPFEDAAFSLKKKGEIAGPIKTQYGYHIIQFIDRKAPHTMKFMEVKTRLLNELRSEKERSRMDELVNKLKAEAEIQVIE